MNKISNFLIPVTFIFLSTAATAAVKKVATADTEWKNHRGMCVTRPYPSTTFAFVTDTVNEESVVKVSVVHHNGLSYAPFWETLVVPADLQMLADKSKTILSLADVLNTSWAAKECQWTGDKKVACMGHGEKVKINSKVIEPWAFYSSVITDSSFAGDYTYIHMTMIFYIDGEKFIYAFKYKEADCAFDEKILQSKR